MKFAKALSQFARVHFYVRFFFALNTNWLSGYRGVNRVAIPTEGSTGP